jgi:hypothetical protein
MQINYTFDSNIYVPDSNSSDFLTELQTNLLGSTVPDSEIREINPHYRGFVQAVQAACAIFDNDFADNITVTIQFDFGAVTGEGGHSNNEIPAGATGANMLGAEPNPTFSYSDVHGYLQHELTAKSGDTFFTQAFGTLPSSWNNSGTFALTYPQLKAMGQYNASAGEVDGYVGLADTYYWTSGGMVEVLEHEISEVLGRGAGTIVQGPRDASQRDDGENTYTPLDLFRYSAGSPDLVANGGAYFSIDGGITSGGPYFDPTASGDPDAEDFNVADPFGYSTITSGYVVSDPTFSEVDFNEMDVIGYDPIYTKSQERSSGYALWCKSSALSGGRGRAVDLCDTLRRRRGRLCGRLGRPRYGWRRQPANRLVRGNGCGDIRCKRRGPASHRGWPRSLGHGRQWRRRVCRRRRARDNLQRRLSGGRLRWHREGARRSTTVAFRMCS